jgi:hypothetical protein
MEIKWVMSDEERLLHNLTRSRGTPEQTTEKRKAISPLLENEEAGIDTWLGPKEKDMFKYMSPEEKAQIESILFKYHDSYMKIPYTVPKTNGNRGPVEVIKMFTTIIRRFALFCTGVEDFSRLTTPDQQNLLRAGVLEMCLLRSAHVFDMDNNRWPAYDKHYMKDCPSLRLEDMEKLVSPELYDMHKRFISSFQKLKADEPTVVLLLLVILFYPDRAEVQDCTGINQSQEKFISLLQKYVQWRYGAVNGAQLFPRLLSKLADLRQLNDCHTAYNLKLGQEDLHLIQNQLGQMNLNNCQEWDGNENSPLIQLDTNQHQNSTISENNWNSFPQSDHGIGHDNLGYIPQIASENEEVQRQRSGNATQGYFQQFITEKIPTLIQNPFAPLSFEADILQAKELFENAFSNRPEMLNMDMMQKAAAFANLKNISFPIHSQGQNEEFQSFQSQSIPTTFPSNLIAHPLSQYFTNNSSIPLQSQQQDENKEMTETVGAGFNELHGFGKNDKLFGSAFPPNLDISTFLGNNYSNGSPGEDWTHTFSLHGQSRQRQLSETEITQRQNGMNNYEALMQSDSNSFDL